MRVAARSRIPGGFSKLAEKQYSRTKLAELRELSRFVGASLRKKSLWSFADLAEEKQRIRTLLRKSAEDLYAFGESNFYETPNGLVEFAGRKFKFDYQRIFLKSETKDLRKAFYPKLVLPTSFSADGFFASSCQGAITCAFQTIRNLQPSLTVRLPFGAYWETAEFLNSFQFLKRNLKKPTLRIVYYDSSMEPRSPGNLNEHLDSTSDLLMIDTTCFMDGSRRLQELVDRAARLRIPCLLFRSHMKLDCLGTEFGRLGSVLWLIPEKGNRQTDKEFQDKFWPNFTRAAARHGAYASLQQIYPFLENPRIRTLGKAWQKRIRKNTRELSDFLEVQLSQNVRNPYSLRCFDHEFYFWLGTLKELSKKELFEHVNSLVKALQLFDVPVRWIASYPWDFLGISSFYADQSEGNFQKFKCVIRISSGDFDRATNKRALLAFKLWINWLDGNSNA